MLGPRWTVRGSVSQLDVLEDQATVGALIVN